MVKTSMRVRVNLASQADKWPLVLGDIQNLTWSNNNTLFNNPIQTLSITYLKNLQGEERDKTHALGSFCFPER